MRTFIFLPILTGLILVGGCKKTSQGSADYRPGTVTETSKNFLIPRDLKSEIEAEYLSFVRKENPKIVLPDEEILGRIPREFLDIEVFFQGSAPGILKHDVAFHLPRGGGTIDLKDYVVGKKGSFHMRFRTQRSNEPEFKIKDLRIYFSSEVKSRRIDGELFGSGCRRFMEVTDQVAKSDDAGFLLNATDSRYYPVIGGTFYFVDFNPERKMYLGAVRIEDSRYAVQACPEALL